MEVRLTDIRPLPHRHCGEYSYVLAASLAATGTWLSMVF